MALNPDKQVFNIQGYLNGRVTTDDNTTKYQEPQLNEQAELVPEGDFVADANASMYYISIDPSGKLGWQQNYVDYGGVNSHVIEVLTEKVSNAYKDFLRRLDISYIIAGKEQLDDELRTIFCINFSVKCCKRMNNNVWFFQNKTPPYIKLKGHSIRNN